MRLRNGLYCILFFCLAITGCSKKTVPYLPESAIDGLRSQSSKIQSVQGKAWIHFKSPEGSLGFLANFYASRKNTERPRMRFEAVDPFGATHALVVLDPNLKLTWIDFDHKQSSTFEKSWHGVALEWLPDFLLGVAAFPRDTKVVEKTEDTFSLRSQKAEIKYKVFWGGKDSPYLLEGIEASKTEAGLKERVSAEYSKFLGEDDFRLPAKVEITGFENDKEQIKILIQWRNREWNESLPDALFQPVPLD